MNETKTKETSYPAFIEAVLSQAPQQGCFHVKIRAQNNVNVHFTRSAHRGPFDVVCVERDGVQQQGWEVPSWVDLVSPSLIVRIDYLASPYQIARGIIEQFRDDKMSDPEGSVALIWGGSESLAIQRRLYDDEGRQQVRFAPDQSEFHHIDRWVKCILNKTADRLIC